MSKNVVVSGITAFLIGIAVSSGHSSYNGVAPQAQQVSLSPSASEKSDEQSKSLSAPSVQETSNKGRSNSRKLEDNAVRREVVIDTARAAPRVRIPAGYFDEVAENEKCKPTIYDYYVK